MRMCSDICQFLLFCWVHFNICFFIWFSYDKAVIYFTVCFDEEHTKFLYFLQWVWSCDTGTHANDSSFGVFFYWTYIWLIFMKLGSNDCCSLCFTEKFGPYSYKSSCCTEKFHFDFITWNWSAIKIDAHPMIHFLHHQVLKFLLNFKWDFFNRLQLFLSLLIKLVDDLWGSHWEFIPLPSHFLEQNPNMSIYYNNLQISSTFHCYRCWSLTSNINL